MSERTDRAKSIFLEAIDRHAPEQWPAFLEQTCGDDLMLRAEVEKLLRAQGDLGSFHEQTCEPVSATIDQPAAERPGTVIGPYKLLEEIGEGGMGTVWMAEQLEPIHRRVAVKVVKAGMDSRQVLARFEAERQALALMDHPNIARVLDAGTTPAGRPYFVMELVKGVRITKFCDERHLTPRQRLELFVPVCQAIQHAHQKGIIHRDIKPSNVLIALYDDKPVPKVIDFGVAKATGQQLTEKSLHTGFGAVVGTPEYMSPEQAGFNQLDVDTRSDIYSLGVLLYELLAGSPPFSRKDLERAGMLEMLRVIREEEPSKPSTKLSTAEGLPTLAANRGTEPKRLTKLVRGELDWIVMKALEKDRGRRYETANGFAADVQRYLVDEPVQACPPSALYRFRKFARRNKRALATAILMGVMLLAAVGVVAGTLGWAARERSERSARVAGQVELVLADVDRLMGEQKWPEALGAARRAEAALAGGEADEATGRRVGRVVADLEFIDRLQQIRLDRAIWVNGSFNNEGAAAAYAKAFRAYGVDIESLPAGEAVSASGLRPGSPLAKAVAAALDNWEDALWHSIPSKSETSPAAGKVNAVARLLDPDRERDRLRALSGRTSITENNEELRRLAAAAASWESESVALMAWALERAGLKEESVAVLRQGQQRFPGDFWLNFQLALASYQLGRTNDAVRYASVSIALRPTMAAAHVNLGAFLCEGASDYPGAVAACREAIRLDPDHEIAHFNLGNALIGQGKPGEAVASYREAIRLKPNFFMAHYNLGTLFGKLQKEGEAIPCLREAIRLNPGYAEAHYNLATMLRKQGKPDEAGASLREAIRLNPKSADAHHNLGTLLRQQGKPGEAAASYREAARLNPGKASTHYFLGIVLDQQNKLDEAATSLREAIRIQPDYASAHAQLGLVLFKQGKADEALVCYRASVRYAPGDAVHRYNLGVLLNDPALRDYRGAEAALREAIRLKPDLEGVHYQLGIALLNQKKPEEAVASFREAIRRKPDHALAHFHLGSTLCGQKKWAEAITSYREAIRLQPDDAKAHNNLGGALKDSGKLAEAIPCFRESIRLDPDFAGAHYNLGTVLRRQGKLGEAIVCFREAIRLQPDDATAHGLLGSALKEFGKPAEAIASYREAIRLKPDYVDIHYHLGIVLAGQGKTEEALECYRQAIRLQPSFAEAHVNLGNLLGQQGKLAEAEACYREALRHKPDLWQANLNLGNTLGQQGKEEQAVPYLQKAIRLRPDLTDAHISLAWLRANSTDPKLRDTAQAVTLARTAVERNPRNSTHLAMLGMAEYRAGNWKAAAQALEQALELRKGGDGLAWIFLSMTKHQLGQKDQARQWYDRAARWIDEKRPKDEVFRHLQAEAAALLGIDDSKAKPDKK